MCPPRQPRSAGAHKVPPYSNRPPLAAFAYHAAGMEPEPQYYILQGENVQGPYALSKVRAYIEQGRVRANMKFSRDGGDWVRGRECPELFPSAKPGPSPAPAAPAPSPNKAPAPSRSRERSAAPPREARQGRRSRRPTRRHMPSSVLSISVLDFVRSLLALIAGIIVMALVSHIESQMPLARLLEDAESYAEMEDALNTVRLIGYLGFLLAALYLLLGIWIRSGQPAARGMQFLVTGLSLAYAAYALLNEAAAKSSILGIAIDVLILILLCGSDTSAFFSGREPRRRGRR